MILNDNELKAILEELYAMDSSLKSREQELITIINGIIEKKPDAAIDPSFVSRLRSQVMAEIPGAVVPGIRIDFSALKNMNKIMYALYGATATVLVIAISFATLYGGPARNGKDLATSMAPAGKTSVIQKLNKVGQSAFGSLRGGGAASPVSSTLGMGGGSGIAMESARSANATAPAPGSDGAGVSAKMDSRIMPPVEGRNIKFVYKGGDLNLENSQLDVLKRTKNLDNSLDINSLIGGLGVGYVNLASFPDQKLQNLNFIQKGDFGYITTVMLEEGTVSIYQNWETWPAGKCVNDMKCYENLRVSLSDMPDDQSLIAIADQFIADHGIDRSNFGDPEINTEWRRQYEAASDKTSYYFPDSVEVVYPLKINDKVAYDEYNGWKTGLSVYVQVKDRKVSSVNNLSMQVYESSSYEMETDPKVIIAAAEKGGFGGNYYWGETKIEDLELSDPEMVYAKHYAYKDGQSQELYVPALYFPIKNMPKDMNFNRRGIVIPLAKELLEEQRNNGAIDGPGIMPMMEKAVQ